MKKYLPSFYRILTAVCVFVSVVLAFYMISQRFAHLTNGFQYDELYSAITANPFLPFSFIWKEILLQDVNLPLFNILLYGWNHVVPYNHIWMHVFSALLGTIAVFCAWFCAPKTWPLLKRCIYFTLIAGSFILVAYGAIIRSYSLFVLMTVIFTLLALRIIDAFTRHEKPTCLLWLGFFTAGLLGAYSHFFCSGVFFITALVVFLYACYYKIGRAWAFWGTAVVFAVWMAWVVQTFFFLKSTGGSWWFDTPTMKASLDIFVFLFGNLDMWYLTLLIVILGAVSLLGTYKLKVFNDPSLLLPLVQIVLLCTVIAVVSLKFNLWLDRYFLALMPAILLLLTVFFYHLYERHKVLLVLWPILLFVWVAHIWTFDYLIAPEYIGVHDAVNYLINELKVEKVVASMEGTGYPAAAIKPMFSYYVPKDKKLEIIKLTKETAPLAVGKNRLPVLMPLCSQIHLINMSLDYGIEEEDKPLLFGRPDVCVLWVKPMPWLLEEMKKK